MAAKIADNKALQELNQALLQRDISHGFALLESAFPAPGATAVPLQKPVDWLLSVAQWVDLGFRDTRFLAPFFAAISGNQRKKLTVADYTKFRLAEAYKLLAEEQPQRAIAVLDLLLQMGDGLDDSHLQFLANFWKGRAHRKQGEYEAAVAHIAAAKAAAHSAKAPKLEAVTKIHESWLAFQGGKRQYALTLLDEAEAELKPTGHNLSLGNIASARGRFLRRSGEYARALQQFDTAIHLYRAGCPHHPNVARALVNAAYVKRLIALDLQPRNGRGHASGAVHARSLQAKREALALLQEAGEIYAQHQHQGGTGSVLVNTAHLHLESGEIDEADSEGSRAFAVGEAKGDQILMARARIVQSAVELARAEEQVGEEPDIARHANLAVEFAEMGISLALHTQNKRLLCEAYIARAMAAAADYFQEWDAARDYAGKAAALLSFDDRDHLFQQLSVLRAKLSAETHVEDRLRLWSEGVLDAKTFQQVQEEFAELVIAKVWQKTGRNISAVAKLLSVSPKKIRRVLRSSQQSAAPPRKKPRR